MSAETLNELFSHICGQTRSFVADGMLLPVDQRCLGLYVGTLMTALWLLGTGIWRHGLPGRGIVALHVALLLLAMLGGLHVIDPGPLWRFVFGLWTGHVALLWLIGAAVHFDYLSRPDRRPEPPWKGAHNAQGAAFPLILAALAWGFPMLLPLGWGFWSAAAILGVGAMATGLVVVAVEIVRFALRMSRTA